MKCSLTFAMFHGICSMPGGDRDKEEALAVATAFFYLENAARDKRTHSGKLPQPIFRAFMSMMFQYTYKGYRDWVLYQTDSNYKQGMIDYLVPQNTGAFLGSANVDVAGILENIKSSLGGGVQVVIQ